MDDELANTKAVRQQLAHMLKEVEEAKASLDCRLSRTNSTIQVTPPSLVPSFAKTSCYLCILAMSISAACIIGLASQQSIISSLPDT